MKLPVARRPPSGVRHLAAPPAAQIGFNGPLNRSFSGACPSGGNST